ncbi:hypothetical protein Tdes44962_MAKER02486 [Teratosphaeria destructans]|uniref:Uncharacterized protein n=1 Tax=Teratosphaeria destructans TaxID=418781 RepID=A0A9W7W338_9PEZI|nr:hypothetical protein Tdes44962_MAKER02486 [Teratosphaeria destructans]
MLQCTFAEQERNPGDPPRRLGRLVSLPIPLTALLERDAFATEDIKCTANRQIDLASTQTLDQLQILQVASTASIGDVYSADLGEVTDEFLVYTRLQALGVCGVDEEFAAVWLEESNVFWTPLSDPRSSFLRLMDSPLLISNSVIFCHLSIATLQPSPTRRQLRSITSLLLSPSNALRTD